MTTLDAALNLAGRGWHVLPVKPRGKLPATKHGLKDATRDAAQIRGWWANGSRYGLAVACEPSGMVVLDVDPRNGGDGTLARLEAEHGPLPATVEAQTGGDGRHLCYRAPGGDLVGSLGPGLDVKHRGYILVSPSVHPSGKSYRWTRGPDEHELADLPAAWAALLRKPAQQAPRRSAAPTRPCAGADGSAYGLAALRAECDAVRSAGEGARNNRLNEAAYAAGQLIAGGELAEAFATDELARAGTDAGLGEREIQLTLRSGSEAGKREPRQAPPKGDRDGRASDAPPWAADEPPPDDGAPPPADKDIPPDASGDGKRPAPKRGPSQATLLVDLACESGAELWHCSDGIGYATVRIGDHRENWRLRSKPARTWLAKLFHRGRGGAPSSEAIGAALNTLEGMARFDGAEYVPSIRVAGDDTRTVLDLADAEWRAVEVTAGGWRVLDALTAFRFRFLRPPGVLPLPAPVRGGEVSELRGVLNIDDEQWPLLVAWLVAALRPAGPYPIAALNGEQGSAKTTGGRIMRSFVDPNRAPMRSEPREPRDLMITAANSWVVALDNLSGLKPWLSDALCRMSTGGGFATREMYADADEVIFDAQRPVILTSISDVATRADLLDRCLLLQLPTIPEEKRRTDDEIATALEAIRPRVLGALLDAVSMSIRRRTAARAELPYLPRMASFAVVATAAEPALGLDAGQFMEVYGANRSDAIAVALEASPVVGPLDIVAKRSVGRWEGTAEELLSELTQVVDEATRRRQSWPRTARGLAGILRRLAPALRQYGLDLRFDREPGGARRRLICIERVSQPSRPSRNRPGETPTISASRDGRDDRDGSMPLLSGRHLSTASPSPSFSDPERMEATVPTVPSARNHAKSRPPHRDGRPFFNRPATVPTVPPNRPDPVARLGELLPGNLELRQRWVTRTSELEQQGMVGRLAEVEAARELLGSIPNQPARGASHE